MISGGGSGQQPQYASGDKVKRVSVDPSVALMARTESALPVGSSLLPRQQRSNYQQQQEQEQEREQHMPSALGMLTSAGGRRLSSPPHENGPIATTLLTATVEGGNSSGLPSGGGGGEPNTVSFKGSNTVGGLGLATVSSFKLITRKEQAEAVKKMMPHQIHPADPFSILII